MSREAICGEASKPNVVLKKGGLCIKQIDKIDESIMGYHLRHEVFSKELRWVPERSDELEIDEYDSGAVCIGVFDGRGSLLAYMRILLPERRFMIEKEFRSLIADGHEIRKTNDTAEISRLCVAPTARRMRIKKDFGLCSVSMLLLKGAYHWCVGSGVRYLYFVVEHRAFRMFQIMGFPCRLVGEPKVMPDGVIAVASILDLREFERLNARNRPGMFDWFTHCRSGRVPSRPPPHEAGLPRQVFG